MKLFVGLGFRGVSYWDMKYFTHHWNLINVCGIYVGILTSFQKKRWVDWNHLSTFGVSFCVIGTQFTYSLVWFWPTFIYNSPHLDPLEWMRKALNMDWRTLVTLGTLKSHSFVNYRGILFTLLTHMDPLDLRMCIWRLLP